MYTSTDLDKLRQIMAKSTEHTDIFSRFLASQKEFLSVITHEIRNPLTLVYSSLQLIEAEHPEVRSFRHWDAMYQDVLYMMHLLTDLSDYNNSFKLHKNMLDTGTFLKQLALSFAASAETSNIEFTSRICPELPPLQADTAKLKEVLINLLKNAFEAFPAGSTGFVRLDADTVHTAAAITEISSSASSIGHDTCLRIRIQDNGCGIPQERLGNIFAPFVTYKSDGTGLGLPISKRIIEAHGGSIQVDSAPDAGTLFTILLPLSPVPASDDSCDIV